MVEVILFVMSILAVFAAGIGIGYLHGYDHGFDTALKRWSARYEKHYANQRALTDSDTAGGE